MIEHEKLNLQQELDSRNAVIEELNAFNESLLETVDVLKIEHFASEQKIKELTKIQKLKGGIGSEREEELSKLFVIDIKGLNEEIASLKEQLKKQMVKQSFSHILLEELKDDNQMYFTVLEERLLDFNFRFKSDEIERLRTAFWKTIQENKNLKLKVNS